MFKAVSKTPVELECNLSVYILGLVLSPNNSELTKLSCDPSAWTPNMVGSRLGKLGATANLDL